MSELARRVEYSRRETCWDCEIPIPAQPPLWKQTWTYRSKRYHTVHLAQVCAACFEAAAALVEAEADGRRLSRVNVHEPCACGRPSLAAIGGYCVLCWREHRMLDKQLAEVRFLNRMIATIRREANGHQDRRIA